MQVIQTTESIEVKPELRLGDGNPIASDTTVIPAIEKTGERKHAVGGIDTPDTCGLETGKRTIPWVLPLEIIFIECLHGESA